MAASLLFQSIKYNKDILNTFISLNRCTFLFFKMMSVYSINQQLTYFLNCIYPTRKAIKSTTIPLPERNTSDFFSNSSKENMLSFS